MVALQFSLRESTGFKCVVFRVELPLKFGNVIGLTLKNNACSQGGASNPETYTDKALAPDHFKIQNGVEFAGTHLILDLWGAKHLTNDSHIQAVLKQCVVATGASLLHIHTHQFSDSGGISGVAVLAESHISIHTWPERAYAALDIFMCGVAEPELAIPILIEGFEPDRHELTDIKRGKVVVDEHSNGKAKLAETPSCASEPALV